MENHHFLWENPLLMAIFNSYVELPEGNHVPKPASVGRKVGVIGAHVSVHAAHVLRDEDLLLPKGANQGGAV